MKPGDFLIGVLDFFSIILPGMMATWLVVQYVPQPVLRQALTFGIEAQPNPYDWVLVSAFLLSSYTLGHFVFMIGSHLDESYDHWRRHNKPSSRDKAFLAAEKLRATVNEELVGSNLTVLKWARAYVTIKASHARAEIDRFEADQKFFRSLVVVMCAFGAHFWLRESAPGAGLGAVIMAVLSYQRYVDQRWKMTELIYSTALITYKATAPAAPPGK
jgi:hypothetical protein